MRPNLIARLKEEWNNLDPVDPLRGLIADAIDALVEAQPSKPWAGLTDEEIEARAINFYNPEMYKRAVLWAQEKLKERNQ